MLCFIFTIAVALELDLGCRGRGSGWLSSNVKVEEILGAEPPTSNIF